MKEYHHSCFGLFDVDAILCLHCDVKGKCNEKKYEIMFEDSGLLSSKDRVAPMKNDKERDNIE
jgi:hypothetical protein